jgi:hypothetical protein
MARTNANKQEIVAVQLASGLTVKAAAKAGRVSMRTVFNWQKDPAFLAHVAALRTDMRERATGRTARGMSKAAARLVKLLDSDKEVVQLQAAKALLELGVKLRDALELEQRIKAMEERLKHDTRHPT